MATELSRSYLAVRGVKPPASSSIRSLYNEPDLRYAYEMNLSNAVTNNPERLARHLYASPAPWFDTLTRVRDGLLTAVGIKTSRKLTSDMMADSEDRISFFHIFHRQHDEIVFGQDSLHLDLRTSVLMLPADVNHPLRRLVVVTVVKCHNRFGKLYLALIAPFHRILVRSSLRHAATLGWPS